MVTGSAEAPDVHATAYGTATHAGVPYLGLADRKAQEGPPSIPHVGTLPRRTGSWRYQAASHALQTNLYPGRWRPQGTAVIWASLKAALFPTSADNTQA
jgi:hypothetical protein